MKGQRLFVIWFAAAVMVAAGGLMWSGTSRAEPGAMAPDQKAAVEKVVHDYLINNPEVLVEAMAVLRDRKEKSENEERKQAIKAHLAELTNDPAAPVLGNPKGNLTIVEFFDYACPYCKSVEDDLLTLMKSDGQIRLVLKQFPVLGDNSVFAAKAALAARAQGKYSELHNALMTTHGQLSEATVLRLARSVGLDEQRLKADMAAPAIEAALIANHGLAEALSIRGTPAFVVGNSLYPGAHDLASFKAMVAAARKG